MFRNTLVFSLCALSVVANAATFTAPVNTSITSTLGTDVISGGIGGSVSPDGSSLLLYSTGPVVYSIPEIANERQMNTITLTWSGAGSGQMVGTLPVSWLFSLNVSNSDALSSLSWALTFLINGAEVLSVPRTFAESLPEQVIGSDFISLPNATLNNWQVNLVVSFESLFNGDSLTIDIPSNSTIDLGPLAATNSVPEPSSLALTLAGCGVVMALRRRRL